MSKLSEKAFNVTFFRGSLVDLSDYLKERDRKKGVERIWFADSLPGHNWVFSSTELGPRTREMLNIRDKRSVKINTARLQLVK